MTKREYADAVAAIVNGEVKEVNKTNGKKMIGISPKGDMAIRPIVYIDEMYDCDVSVENAAENVEDMFVKHADVGQDFDPNNVGDFDKMRPLLRARLYNEKTVAEVFESAKLFGFDDLIIIPYLEFMFKGQDAGIKVNNQLLQKWGVDKETVISIAKANSEKYSDFFLSPMSSVLCDLMEDDMPEELLDMPVPMYVVSNKKKNFGAFGVIALADLIEEKFPNGYAVIPSSVHEVIIIPSDSEMYDTVKDMIGDVNTAMVSYQEILGWKPYYFG